MSRTGPWTQSPVIESFDGVDGVFMVLFSYHEKYKELVNVAVAYYLH
jgi:hypothetical protein